MHGAAHAAPGVCRTRSSFTLTATSNISLFFQVFNRENGAAMRLLLQSLNCVGQ
jgi:hypothetical protein